MNFPDDETGQVLAEMHQAGIDLGQSHDVVFFHLFEQESQAQAMVDHIKEHLPAVKCDLHPDETPNVWDVDCTVVITPSHEAIVEQEAALEKIATSFSGYSDGWGIEA
ncbi:MAG: ribonuclease E inhibitor RraB [Pseudoalteromonas sp.]|uniref:ribonuclease E inhibitor RraB n=1 Tax=Pseudoalteromonas sp. TaxID=53249 RepID=UPI001D6A189D|nr:ribonuclease E inhibitor RraB [Pseudoalteromonas sp.]NRA81581.1 ribonuclease E inhibitor RraB [Pseudoalteromonas sp.]